jgi:hypothetical protein
MKEADIGRTVVPGQPVQKKKKNCETLSSAIAKRRWLMPMKGAEIGKIVILDLVFKKSF